MLNSSTVQCYNGPHYNSVQCSAVQCSAIQCSAVQCSAAKCSEVQCECSLGQCSAVFCIIVLRYDMNIRPIYVHTDESLYLLAITNLSGSATIFHSLI